MRLFTSIFVLLLVLAFSAQASKLGEGRKIVGGSLSFQSASGDRYEINGDGQTMFSLSPSAAIFLGAPGLAVGAELNFSTWSQGDNSTSSWGIGPMVQYYFGAEEDKDMYPFVGASFLYSSMTRDFGNETTDTETVIHLTGGVLYFLNNNVGINANLFYDMHSYEPDGGSSIDGSIFGVGAGFSILID